MTESEKGKQYERKWEESISFCLLSKFFFFFLSLERQAAVTTQKSARTGACNLCIIAIGLATENYSNLPWCCSHPSPPNSFIWQQKSPIPLKYVHILCMPTIMDSWIGAWSRRLSAILSPKPTGRNGSVTGSRSHRSQGFVVEVLFFFLAFEQNGISLSYSALEASFTKLFEPWV